MQSRARGESSSTVSSSGESSSRVSSGAFRIEADRHWPMFALRSARMQSRCCFRACHASFSPIKKAAEFVYQPLFDLAPDTTTEYRLLTKDHVRTVSVDGEILLKVEPEGLRRLTAQAMTDINHLLRPGNRIY